MCHFGILWGFALRDVCVESISWISTPRLHENTTFMVAACSFFVCVFPFVFLVQCWDGLQKRFEIVLERIWECFEPPRRPKVVQGRRMEAKARGGEARRREAKATRREDG